MNNPIKVINDGPVLEVTIDRPKANAIDRETSIIMGKTFQDFRDNPDQLLSNLFSSDSLNPLTNPLEDTVNIFKNRLKGQHIAWRLFDRFSNKQPIPMEHFNPLL